MRKFLDLFTFSIAACICSLEFGFSDSGPTHIIGLMVDFPYEENDDPLTTGRGVFLQSSTDQYSLDTVLLCNGFLVDSPPHDKNYFDNQIKAVSNYYSSVSNNNVNFENNFYVLDSIYTVSNPMRSYAVSDKKLAEFFNESLRLAKNDIENLNLDVSNSILVVFHAGMGQDFSVPFIDPTSHDLKSAYVDEQMLDGTELVEISGHLVTRGIILPETQNMIYFDVAQDIFSSTSDLCDIQIGLTGTFALLFGYAFDLPPLFNTVTGSPGVGVFGLMDYGSNNGRGIIPSPPSPWTRIKKGWSNEIVITESGQYTVRARHNNGDIYRINISDTEYFLIENRNNWIIDDDSIDSLRVKNDDGVYNENLDYWFDTFLTNISSNVFDTTSGVFTKIENYDFGTPGSGILIWHIDESRINDQFDGINNDINNMAIRIEEADGAVDIGNSNLLPSIWDEHIYGWAYDMWYIGNPDYSIVNSYSVSSNEVIFDNDTRPNSNTSKGLNSGVSINILSEPAYEMIFSVDFKSNLNFDYEELSNYDVSIIGNGQINNIGHIFYSYNNKIYMKNFLEEQLISNLDTCNKALIQNDVYYLINEMEQTAITYLDLNGNLMQSPDFFVIGNLTTIEQVETLPQKYSLGDVDLDGLDEIILVNNGNYIDVKDYPSDVSTNGFPIMGDFRGQPLIADILDIDDKYPEIIVREQDKISILSFDGKIIEEIPSFSQDQLFIVPNWKNGNAALVDGNRLLLFEFDENDSYWLNEFSQSSNYPMSSGIHEYKISDSHYSIFDAYNYPNPVYDEGTSFRFYVDGATNATIDIYDVMGLHVISLKNSTLFQKTFNEIRWIPEKQIEAGLYFAKISLSSGQEKLVKVVLIR